MSRRGDTVTVAALVLSCTLFACKGKRHKSTSSARSGPAPTAAPSRQPPPGKPMTPFVAKGGEGLSHKPVVVLWQMNPWLDVIGSDVPSVVVYDDGLVVRHKLEGRSVSRLEGHLSKVEAQALAAKVDAGLATSAHHSMASGATDQPTVDILVESAGKWREASCYGLSARGVSSTAGHAEMAPPAGFVDAFKALLGVAPPDEKAWVPEEIEIMLWGFPGASAARPWPSAVPPPPASVTPPPPGQGVVKHVVDGKHEPAMKAYLASGPAIVELNGHSWSVSYRPRVPAEDFIQKVRTCAARHAAAEAKGTPPPPCE